MKAQIFLLLALPSIVLAAKIPGAVLKAEVEGDTLVIYSSMKKPGGCKAALLFSYQKGGHRQMSKLECNFRVPAEDHHRFCVHSNPEFVDLKIESSIAGGCE
jgi:hypothetical protein